VGKGIHRTYLDNARLTGSPCRPPYPVSFHLPLQWTADPLGLVAREVACAVGHEDLMIASSCARLRKFGDAWTAIRATGIAQDRLAGNIRSQPRPQSSCGWRAIERLSSLTSDDKLHHVGAYSALSDVNARMNSEGDLNCRCARHEVYGVNKLRCG